MSVDSPSSYHSAAGSRSVMLRDINTIRMESSSHSSSKQFKHAKTTQTALQIELKNRMAEPQCPPVGTYQLPTTFDDNSYDKRNSASFKSSGRSETFMENNNVYFKNNREESSKTNLGPGLYNVAYELGNSNNSHFHLLESQTDSNSCNTSKAFSSNRSFPVGSYKRTWLNGKAPPTPPTPRAQQMDKDEELISIDSVRSLPSY